MKKSGLAFFAMIFLLISNYSFGQGVDIDTSIMLHIKPELVHLKKIDSAQENKLQSKTKGSAVRCEKGKDLAYYHPDNYRDASKSSAELGIKFLEVLSENLAEIIKDLK